jgi:uncharacterized protein YgiM (DUF1202 family)
MKRSARTKRNGGAAWRALALCLGTLTGAVGAQTVEITGDNVNLRARPSLKSEVVGQVSRGRRLNAGPQKSDGWIQVEPPATVGVWVFAKLVENGRVRVANLQVRAGPGINYSVLSTVKREQRVAVRKAVRDWLEIEPPTGCYVWVSAAYAQIPGAAVKPETPLSDVNGREANETTAQEITNTATETTTEDGASSVKVDESVALAPLPIRKPPLPADDERPPQSETETRRKDAGQEIIVAGGFPPEPHRDQGDKVTRTGRLRRAGFVLRRGPGEYRLIGTDGKGRAVTVCYLTDGGKNLETLLGREVMITGHEYWVQGLRAPVLAPESISLEE